MRFHSLGRVGCGQTEKQICGPFLSQQTAERCVPPRLVAKQNAGLKQTYFGRRLGSPPGLPGGGMTGILPVSGGVGARISGSTPDGGHSTPSDLASLSPSGSWDWPTVSRGAFAPPEPIRSQLVGDCGGGGAVCCGGVAGVGGACAIASADVASNAQTINSERSICMRTQPRSEASVPKMLVSLRIAGLLRKTWNKRDS